MVEAPYFVVEGNDVGAQADYDAIERHLEPIDVERGTYRLFDAAGTEISLSVAKGRVNVGLPIGSDPGLLKQTLITYLAAAGRQWGIDVAHLSQADSANCRGGVRGKDLRCIKGEKEGATLNRSGGSGVQRIERARLRRPSEPDQRGSGVGTNLG